MEEPAFDGAIKKAKGRFVSRVSGFDHSLIGTGMKRFFFDLVGDLPARDFLGHECASKKEAQRYGAFVAHRLGTERPSFVKPGNRISVRDEQGKAISAIPIAITPGRFHQKI
jgi:uncharacterized protein DUF6894